MKKLFSKFVVILLGASMLTQLPFNFTSAETDSIWTDEILAEELGRVGNDVNRGNTICEYGNINQRKIYSDNATIVNGKITAIEGDDVDPTFENRCLVQNNRGLYGIGSNLLWSASNVPAKALALKPDNNYIEPAPGGGDSILIKTNSSQGQYISINYNISDGELGFKQNGTLLSLEWRLSNIADALRYASGTPIQTTGAHAFSSNGQWLVTKLSNQLFVKINLRTRSITPFYIGQNTPNYMAVSNDGDYVVSYWGGNLLLHDLTGCENEFSEGNLAESSVTIAGC